jgi:hypothetical protein
MARVSTMTFLSYDCLSITHHSHEASYGPFDDPKDIVLRLRSLEPYYELREKWHYNNMVSICADHCMHLFERFV